MTEFSRREALRVASATLSTALIPQWLSSASEAADAPQLTPLNRFPRMVQDHFETLAIAAEKLGLERKRKLKTKADAEAHVQSVRGLIRRCFGPEPERTPLNPRITGVVERDAYRIEKLIFESRPGFLVSANLYIPKDRKFPLPGVVGSCGHSANGKAGETYQSFAQGLARMGYVVLIFDPIGQGERLQYVDENFKPRRGIGVSEHLYAGNQQFIVGEFFGSWRAWDGIRALDYLLTRPEVDPKHVGITGNSGGGTMTTWLCGLDPRWTMAAPGCFVATFRRNLENELPQDTEQCPPYAMGLGLDHDDFLAALAPKPIVILAKERDFFDVRGSQETYERLKRLYTLLGAPDNIHLHVGPTEHGYTIENREAMYRWFNRVTGVSDAQKEPAITLEKDETLYCAPRGQIAELNSRSVFEFTRARATELAKQRPPLTGAALKAKVQSVLGLKQLPMAAPEYRILRGAGQRKYSLPSAVHYAVETDPRVYAVVTRLTEASVVSRPPRGSARALLYISHHSADVELRDEPLLKELMIQEPGVPLFACDVRGIGDSQPNTCGVDQFTKPYGSDYFYAIHSLMLDQPYAAQKTRDVLQVLAFLAANGHTNVHLVARAWGTVPATFAALLSEHVTQVTLKQALHSYETVATNEAYNWPLSAFVPGVLRDFDLPEIYRELTSKRLTQVDPQGAVAKF